MPTTKPDRTLAYVTFCPASKDGVSPESCGKEQTIMLDPEDARKFLSTPVAKRPTIQRAFPYLTADEREVMLSGICPECWERMFGGGDDD
jgi:hypothetical protein